MAVRLTAETSDLEARIREAMTSFEDLRGDHSHEARELVALAKSATADALIRRTLLEDSGLAGASRARVSMLARMVAVVAGQLSRAGQPDRALRVVDDAQQRLAVITSDPDLITPLWGTRPPLLR